MKILKKNILFFITLLVLSKLVAASPQTLCNQDEQVFFSCNVNKKIVSICTAQNPATIPYMEYRFGTEKKIEMTYRGDSLHPKFNRVAVTYASNTATILWFRNDDIDYLLNFPMKGGPSLEVKNAGKTIVEMACKNGWEAVIGEPDRPSPFISEKPDADYSEAKKYWRH